MKTLAFRLALAVALAAAPLLTVLPDTVIDELDVVVAPLDAGPASWSVSNSMTAFTYSRSA
jgi:hypothetical protein